MFPLVFNGVPLDLNGFPIVYLLFYLNSPWVSLSVQRWSIDFHWSSNGVPLVFYGYPLVFNGMVFLWLS